MMIPNFMKMRALALKELEMTLLDMVELLAGFLNANQNKQACHKFGFIIYMCLL
jgi:hypothetical protein